MARKKGNIFSQYWVAVIVGVVLLAFLAWRQVGSSETIPTSNSSIKTFRSNQVMDFAIEVPSVFEITEKSSRVSFSGSKGAIYIDQVFTELNDLDTYILNSKNNLETRLEDREEVSINNLEAVSGFIGDRKEYLIYANGRVYFIFTDSPDLYNDLDQMARSFRYTPN
ncbi:MAG: hypothetical protein HYS86_00655 [Candidatus Chisholmbacteria bacterium]|nr:hypothetical protein [Candidatus Chisholmbacteria bacterium]